MNILIPNATGPVNLGDQIILKPTLDLIKRNFPGANIIVHSNSPWLYEDIKVKRVDFHLIEWVLFADRSKILRFYRLIQLLFSLFLLKFGILKPIFDSRLNQLLYDYKNADIIIFVGGGGLRSKGKIKDGLSLYLLCLIYFFSKQFKVKKIAMPFSFGPFRSFWHEFICVKALSGFDVIAVREIYSFRKLKKWKIENLILSKDFGLLFNKDLRKRKKVNQIIFGFTVRSWFEPDAQKEFEEKFANAIAEYVQKFNISVQPIVQADSPYYRDHGDYPVTKRVVNIMKTKKIKVKKIIKLSNLKDAVSMYSALDLLIGMRMHSNILAATQGVPFVGISYEYKTQGIARDINMQEYCIDAESMTQRELENKIRNAFKNRLKLKHIIAESIKEISLSENERWRKILHNI